MSTFLQFDYLIHDETARKAIENYVEILQEAFKQYQNLWENYIKLQKKYEQCIVPSSFQVTIDEPCTKIKDELIPERQLNITQEESISLLEDTLNVDSIYFNTETDSPPHLKEFLCKDNSRESPSTSPIFSRKYLKPSSMSVKKCARSPKITSINNTNNLMSDMKIHCRPKEVFSDYNKKLEISTSQHVETTFLPDGKKLKQSRLIFRPVNNQTVSSSVQKCNAAILLPKVKQEFIEDIADAKASVATENKTINTSESFEDVIEISPTQRSVTPNNKIMHRLKLKRKTAKQTKSFSGKYKCHNVISSVPLPNIKINNINFALCPSPEHTYIEIDDNLLEDKSLDRNTTNSVVEASKDKVNINNFSPVKICNENVQIKKENQSTTNEIQNIAENKNAFMYEDESFLPAELAVKKSDTNSFNDNLDDIENKPPTKKALLTQFDVLSKRKKDVSEQINMRCKADRAKLNGWDCWECEEYYKNLSLSKDELQKRKNQCSRHRHMYDRPNTPEGFWDPEFPETLSSTYR